MQQHPVLRRHRKVLAEECTDLLKTIAGFRAHKRKVLNDIAEPFRARKRRLQVRQAALNIKGEDVINRHALRRELTE